MLSRRKFGTFAGAAAVTTAAAATPARAQQATKWKMQSMWQAGTINQKVFEDFCVRVKAMSNNRLDIEALAVGTIVAYTETVDAMQNGILDAHQSGGPYFSGKEPALALIGDLNGGYDNPYQMQMWFEYGGGLELAREIYKKFDIHYVGPVWWGVESVPAKKPLRTLADFKGIKMRVPEGLGAEVWRRAGAGVVTLPGSEVYTALERGVIEAADWGTLGMNQDLGYHKIAGFPLYPGFHSMPSAEVAVALPKWNALSKDVQVMLEVATRDFARDMIQRVAVEDYKAAEAAKAQGVELINWSAEERKKFRALAQAAWADWSKKSPMAKRVYDSQLAFLKRLQLLD
ncbi:TRAP-type mannitol/chloroaromatic compound transport system substrate-binding protein [Stella humosa]|uniref:TRAP-type mannitol/chloroaromatic compound transport system substrate-binding protein n=1 Tax=Stella humosa TaxID=94 RepID=A0A3N1MH60_9PROT|nr:TRAP transporter substrate-binding protein [Stella humosa]ROQ01970.1 TRAP-type mannitol/chloroaromatic compound transport system substrate-binding protein [Stella humosa]BBK32359.1 lactate-binding periplasmic protein [Stella humosa]